MCSNFTLAFCCKKHENPHSAKKFLTVWYARKYPWQENIQKDSSLHAGYVTECNSTRDNVNEGSAGCVVLMCKLLQLHGEMYDFTHKVIHFLAQL